MEKNNKGAYCSPNCYCATKAKETKAVNYGYSELDLWFFMCASFDIDIIYGAQ